MIPVPHEYSESGSYFNRNTDSIREDANNGEET